MESTKMNDATPRQDEDIPGPLKPMHAMRDVPLNNRCSNPNHPCAVHRPWVGRTPSATFLGKTTPLRKATMALEGVAERSYDSSSPKGHAGGIAAPASALDPVVEAFGRPRAHSLSREQRHMSLPGWDEVDEEEDMPELWEMEDRRRTVSMSAAENVNQYRTRAIWAFSFRKRCRDCNLAPAFAMKGEPPSYCRAHQMAGMVNVLMDRCTSPRCHKMATYGVHGEGRQRCFSHKEKGMVHALGVAMEEDAAAATASGM